MFSLGFMGLHKVEPLLRLSMEVMSSVNEAHVILQ